VLSASAVDDAQLVGAGRLQALRRAQHGVEGRRRVRPAAVGHGHGADAVGDAQRHFGHLDPGALQGDDAVAARGQLEAAAQGDAVQRRDHRLLHLVEVHQQARAVARVLRRRIRIAQHVHEAADVAAGAEGLGAIAGDDEAGHRRVVLEAADDGEDLVVHLVMQRVHGLGATQGDQLHVAEVVDQDVAQEALVGVEGPRRHRHAGAFAAQADQGLAGGLFAEGTHQVERTLLEAQRQAAAEVEVGRIADLAVDDVHALREEDAQQALADRLRGGRSRLRPFCRAAP
jgi:hypothetical protein